MLLQTLISLYKPVLYNYGIKLDLVQTTSKVAGIRANVSKLGYCSLFQLFV